MSAQQTTAEGIQPAAWSPASRARWERAEAFVRDGLRLAGIVVAEVVSRRPVRPLADEAVRSLPGDELVPSPKVWWNHASTIDARPAEIWPWLVQMGCRRAGWYSYDGLDNGGVPSAERIVPELQHVEVGDIFPMARSSDDTFVVRMVEPERALVIGDATGGFTWTFALEPVPENCTRLISRVRATYDKPAFGLFLKVLLRPIHFAMQRKQLLNLKRLLEATR